MATVKSIEAMMEQFDKLYQKMATSDKVEDMKLFGAVMRKAMQALAEVRPEQAEELIESLCAIEWNNYLTHREAEDIVSKMEPEAKWPFSQLERLLTSDGQPMEEKPYYNKYALWAEMSKIHSDSGRTLQDFMKRSGNSGEGEYLLLLYELALDNLKDRDGVYNIRRYFRLS